MSKKNKSVIMMNSERTCRGWFIPCLCVLMFCLGLGVEKRLNDGVMNSSILESRSRALVQYIELSKSVVDLGEMDVMRRFLEDSYSRRNSLCKGADSEDFVFFWTDWMTNVELIRKVSAPRGPSGNGRVPL